MSVRAWAREYRASGLAICRLEPGEKRPTYKGWNRSSLEPDDFREGDNIGLMAGAISGNLVCPDLDDPDVLAVADRYLPPTRMLEGRPGKPKSHPWYAVVASPSGFARLITEAGTPDEGGGVPPSAAPDMDLFLRACAELGDEMLGPPGTLPS